MKEPDLLNVLSLEDSLLDFEIMNQQLSAAGYHLNISRVETESDFLERICNHTYDIILADYNLPQFDGFEALKLCRIHCPDTPFICISGSIGEIMAIELLKTGAVDYVLKDRMERLPFALQRALDEAKEKRERKQVELSLFKSEEKYRTIFENVQDVFYQTDLNGIILEISPSINYFSEFHRDELLGHSIYEFYSDASERAALLREIYKKGEIRDYEIRLKTKNGEIKYTSVNARLITNSDGQPDHIDGSIRDITERKRSEEIIRKNAEDLNYAQELAKMGSWEFNAETNTYKWSKNMYKMLGFEPFEKEPTYNDFINLVHPEDKHVIDDYNRKLIREKIPVSYDFRYLMPDREVIWIQNSITPVFKNNKLTHLHGVNLDITDKKKAEQELIRAKEKAEASDKLKTAFLNNVSHEIRTPLNGILGFGQIITDPEIPAEEKQVYFKMLNNSSERLLHTVNNFMDISLIVSGNQQAKRKEIRIEDHINQVFNKFRSLCEEKHLVLSLQKPTSASGYILNTDGELFEKIWYQLINNAIKFTSYGQISIGFKKKKNEFHFFVKDSGIGISEEYKNQIFDNFRQEEITDTRKYEGSGIGLSIAKGLVDLLGGKMWLESEKGKGSTFYFSLPID